MSVVSSLFPPPPSAKKKTVAVIAATENCFPELELFDMQDDQFEFVGNAYYRDGDGPALRRAVGTTENLRKPQSFFGAQKAQVLKQTINALADQQHRSDERYSRVKEENAALQARVRMLEEEICETVLGYEERLASEERKHKESITLIGMEKQSHVDNCGIRTALLEVEAEKRKSALEQARIENTLLIQQISDLYAGEQSSKNEIRLLEAEIKRLNLRERENEKARPRYDPVNTSPLYRTTEPPSLAPELDGLSHDDLKTALNDQMKVNRQLRTYIDNVLLNIVESYPELLEIKRNE